LSLAFPPGGVADVVARRLQQKVTDRLKQPVVVEYKPGGGGTIGAAAVKGAAPDGYTLLIANNSILAVNPSLMDKVPYDSIKDFAPISMLVSVSHILVVPKTSTIQSVDDLIARAKSDKGLTYASQGVGGGGHLLAEMLRVKTGAKLQHVPYKGAAPAMQDLLAGHVDLYFDAVSNVVPHLTAGSLRALATTAGKRLAAFPDLPTMTELGYADVQADAWFALLAPAGTPQPIVALLNAAFGEALRDEANAKALRDVGFDVVPGTPEALGKTLSTDVARYRKLIQEIGPGAK
jgi:tripartite-type tricarboxylate transporter receptor subunit TctC